ncbi:unnamed protein product, partial [Amoebophrya sp. A120]
PGLGEGEGCAATVRADDRVRAAAKRAAHEGQGDPVGGENRHDDAGNTGKTPSGRGVSLEDQRENPVFAAPATTRLRPRGQSVVEGLLVDRTNRKPVGRGRGGVEKTDLLPALGQR